MASVDTVPDMVPMPRHQHLIVTVYGLYAREHGGVLAVSDLIRLLSRCGQCRRRLSVLFGRLFSFIGGRIFHRWRLLRFQ